MNQREVWNILAPEWRRLRSKPREYVEEFLSEVKGLILDVGCGAGRNLIKNKKYVAFDFAEKLVLLAKEKAENEKINALFSVASADAIPFKNSTFDGIMSMNVIHVLEGKSKTLAIKEIFRVMKPGAKAIISVWNKNQPRFFLKGKEEYVPWKIDNQKLMRYYYLFTKSELKEFLKQNGFNVLKIFGSRKKAFKLFPMDIIAIVQKP